MESRPLCVRERDALSILKVFTHEERLFLGKLPPAAVCVGLVLVVTVGASQLFWRENEREKPVLNVDWIRNQHVSSHWNQLQVPLIDFPDVI